MCVIMQNISASTLIEWLIVHMENSSLDNWWQISTRLPVFYFINNDPYQKTITHSSSSREKAR